MYELLAISKIEICGEYQHNYRQIMYGKIAGFLDALQVGREQLIDDIATGNSLTVKWSSQKLNGTGGPLIKKINATAITGAKINSIIKDAIFISNHFDQAPIRFQTRGVTMNVSGHDTVESAKSRYTVKLNKMKTRSNNVRPNKLPKRKLINSPKN